MSASNSPTLDACPDPTVPETIHYSSLSPLHIHQSHASTIVPSLQTSIDALASAIAQKKPVTITILGAGSFGTAIAILFARNGNRVIILDYKKERADHINTHHVNPSYLSTVTLPPTLEATTDAHYALETCKPLLVFHAIPLQKSKKYLENVAQYFSPDRELTPIIISMSKGIHMKTLQLMSDIMEETLQLQPEQQVYLSGPSFALEIAEKEPTGFVIASANAPLAHVIALLLAQDKHTVAMVSHDYIGVQVAGALKNAYAIGAGILDGLGMKYNAKALYITRSNAEISAFGLKLGANKDTLAGLSGIGDLLLSCNGPSRNRRVGEGIAQGKDLETVVAEMHEVAEGVPTTRAVYTLAEQHGMLKYMPILRCIHDILYEGLEIKAAMHKLMSLPVASEGFACCVALQDDDADADAPIIELPPVEVPPQL